jgi:hypothetical protein
MRSRKHEDLYADILEAHYSAALCHLANTSYRVGEMVPGNQVPTGLPDNPQVKDSLDSLSEGLKVFLGVDWEDTSYQLGAKLSFDAEKEQFVDHDAANKLLTREYRPPFVVTEKV